MLGRVKGVEVHRTVRRTRTDFVLDDFSGYLHHPLAVGARPWTVALRVGEVADAPWVARWSAEWSRCLPDGPTLTTAGHDDFICVEVRTEVADSRPTIKSLTETVRACAEQARGARFALANRPPDEDTVTGWEHMVLVLADAGFPAPPVPDELRPFIGNPSPWVWATYELDFFDLYLNRDVGPDGEVREGPSALESELESAMAGRDRFACGHVGHGVNSYFMSLVLEWQGQRIGGRIPYGGAYGDAARERHHVATAWLLWRQELEELLSPPSARPQLVARRRARAGR